MTKKLLILVTQPFMMIMVVNHTTGATHTQHYGI